MKNFKCLIVCLLLVGGFALSPFASMSYAQSKTEKKMDKADAKDTKNLVKQWEKDGYKVANSTATLETALLKHKKKLQDDNLSETEGRVTRCKSLNVGKQSAMNNAQNALAQELVADIDGEVESLISQDEDNISEEQDKKIMTFRKSIKINLSGVLTESFAICRLNPDGKTYEYRAFYIIDEDKKQAAINRAVNKSLTDAEVALDLAEKVRNHLNRGKETEE